MLRRACVAEPAFAGITRCGRAPHALARAHHRDPRRRRAWASPTRTPCSKPLRGNAATRCRGRTRGSPAARAGRAAAHRPTTAHGRLANARALLDRTDSLLTELAEPDRQTFGRPFARDAAVLVAAARGDLAAATRRLDALLTDAGDWRERTAAADAACAGWQKPAAGAATTTPPTAAISSSRPANARSKPATRAASTHDDPWLTGCRSRVPAAHRARTARSRRRRGHELAAVVADLTNWRERVRRPVDDELLRAGEALLHQ